MKSRFKTMFGTGGIGQGVVYRLVGNHDLGRNESRMGQLLDQQDFCKLHIIFHYVSVLLRDLKCGTRLCPIGNVGADTPGHALITLMKNAGMDTRFVGIKRNKPTLYSICFQFPDKSGGNITENNSASNAVSVADIKRAAATMRAAGRQGLVMAAPEVPFETRAKLLELGRKNNAFTAASFNSEEIRLAAQKKILRHLDLLAINIDEAKALAQLPNPGDINTVITACIKKAHSFNPDMQICITAGKGGLYGYDKGLLQHLPSLHVKAANTAGAGDAAFAGLLCGLALGLPFAANAPLTCLKLARLFSAMSVTSPHTLHFGFGLKSLRAFAKKCGQPLPL